MRWSLVYLRSGKPKPFFSNRIPGSGTELCISLTAVSFQVLLVICLHKVRFLRLSPEEEGAEEEESQAKHPW